LINPQATHWSPAAAVVTQPIGPAAVQKVYVCVCAVPLVSFMHTNPTTSHNSGVTVSSPWGPGMEDHRHDVTIAEIASARLTCMAATSSMTSPTHVPQ